MVWLTTIKRCRHCTTLTLQKEKFTPTSPGTFLKIRALTLPEQDLLIKTRVGEFKLQGKNFQLDWAISTTTFGSAWKNFSVIFEIGLVSVFKTKPDENLCTEPQNPHRLYTPNNVQKIAERPEENEVLRGINPLPWPDRLFDSHQNRRSPEDDWQALHVHNWQHSEERSHNQEAEKWQTSKNIFLLTKTWKESFGKTLRTN